MTEAAIRQELSVIHDPELRYSIVDLGLVYRVVCPSPDQVQVTMTLTSLVCPLQSYFKEEIEKNLGRFFKDVVIEFTFTPRWSLAQAAPAVREALALQGIGTVAW